MIRLFTENVPWKLLSLAIAVLLWFAFVGESDLATSLSAPIEFRNIPSDLEISSDIVERVQLVVSGPSSRITPANLSDTAVILDLSAVGRPGEKTFTLDNSTVRLPAAVRLTRAVPAQIQLRFEKRLSKQVPVEVRFGVPPPEGYRVAQREVTPQKLTIVGPESRIEQVDGVQTDPIDLSAEVGEAAFQINAVAPDPQIRFQGSPKVTVKLKMDRIQKKTR